MSEGTLLDGVEGARAGYVLAHGAGAGMKHPFMAAVANGLASRSIATLRYEFPYMQARGRPPTGTGSDISKRPDPPKIAQAAVRAAVEEARTRMPKLPLFAGGKSFGGRMTSQAQAAEALPGVRGLIFLGFPLHAVGKPSDERAKHLYDIEVPMLFLQGSRDALADLSLLEPIVKKLGSRATLEVFEEADHSFHVPARTGRKDSQVLDDLLERLSAWVAATR